MIGRDTHDPDARVATIAFEMKSHQSKAVVEHLERFEIAARYGDFYARRGVSRMKLAHEDGIVRVSMAHYNSMEEVDRLVEALRHLPG